MALHTLIQGYHRQPRGHSLQQRVFGGAKVLRIQQIAEHVHLCQSGLHIRKLSAELELPCHPPPFCGEQEFLLCGRRAHQHEPCVRHTNRSIKVHKRRM
jgi:hypothetical protein